VPAVADPYLDPATGILRNLLGATDQATLDHAEADITATRLYLLALKPAPGSFDLAHLQRIHHRLFTGVYAWAGELRTVDIAKPGAFFCPAHRITGYAREVFRRIEHGPALAELTPDDVIDRLPRHLADVNALHPFREGNGRTQRAFFTQWAAQGGVTLDWSRMTLERNIATSSASFRGDLQPLRNLVADIATPADPQDR